MLRVLAISLFAACGFSGPGSSTGTVDAAPGGEPGDPDASFDASFDAAIDGPVVLNCHGMFETVCLSEVPSGTFSVPGATTVTIDTDTSSRCVSPAAGSTITTACILAATSFNIDGLLRATGSKPLILIGTASVTINGSGFVDVSSQGVIRGAGGRGVCSGGGGAGGNAGGIGTTGSQQATSALTDLVGGCTGFVGGGVVANQGAGGLGGGAVLVISPMINMNGRINASGGGGGGGRIAEAGGGGGGSGGAIVLDTQGLVFNGGAILAAQGGGGGEGASLTNAGAPGAFATTAGTAAPGGSGTNSQGGDGGDGAVSSDGSGGGSGNDGGGGGGGGAGRIRTTDASFNNNGQAYPDFN